MSQSKVASPAPRREDKPQKAKQPDGPPVSKLKMGLSDVGGSVFAQGFNEGWYRAGGRRGERGRFVATQNDYLQASVPALGGMLWYLIELYGVGTRSRRRRSSWDGWRRASSSQTLAWPVFFQTLRSRSADARKELEDAQTKAQKAVADNADLKPTGAAQKQLEEMARRERKRRQRRRRKVNPFRATTSDKDRLTALAERLILSMASRTSGSASGEARSTVGAGDCGGRLVAQRELPASEELRPFPALPLL